jgi:ATP-dependent Lhr-like helicase
MELGLPTPSLTVAVRTGDTSDEDRRVLRRRPPQILVTTPESLYLLLTSGAREILRPVETVIVDEVHALAATKRGAHLALSLERLEALVGRGIQRIGLSATQRPLEVIARFLGGVGADRAVTIVDAGGRRPVEVEIVVPVERMDRLGEVLPPEEEPSGPVAGPARRRSIWPAVEPRILDLVRRHRSTIVFVNSRRLAERLALRLNEIAGEEVARAHHGSIAREERRAMEEALKAGRLPAIVATGTLELGIDMGAVDLVIHVASPPSVTAGLQRIGRAGHRVDTPSRGVVFPTHRGDLLAAAVVARRMVEGTVEATEIPRNPLDVLAQQIVAMAVMDPWSVDDLEATVRRAAPFSDLSRAALEGVLGMLAGAYPSDEFAELRPRIVWDRATNVIRGRPEARLLAITSAGTIPDRGLYGVFLAGDDGRPGRRVGELDEEMVYESRTGEVIVLGASSWRIEAITPHRVLVSPAPGEPGKLPFWHGDGVGRPAELGEAVGRFLAEMDEALARGGRSEAARLLQREGLLDPLARENLLDYLEDQRAACGVLPTHRRVVVERFRDELGDWRLVILSPLGGRVHAPWALAIEEALGRRLGVPVQTIWSDDGIVVRLPDMDLPDGGRDLVEALIPPADEVEDLVLARLPATALFAGVFRENAARALLLPRRRPGSRTPLWLLRQRAADLLAVASRYGSFPILVETVRECLADRFDLPALRALLAAVARREVAVHVVETSAPSPFAGSLLFAYVARYMYEGDTPVAERRAQALTVDRRLLADLLGEAELRDLLDPVAVAEVEERLQHLAVDLQAANADELHDLLRRLGDLTEAEVARRLRGGPEAAPTLLHELAAQRRAILVRIAGEGRWIAAEDAGRYRDGVGVPLPPGLPEAYLSPGQRPLHGLLARWARTHGPFTADEPARRFGLPQGVVASVLAELEAEGLVVRGAFRPGPRRSFGRRASANARSTRPATDGGPGSPGMAETMAEGPGLGAPATATPSPVAEPPPDPLAEWCHTEVLRQLRSRSLAHLRRQAAAVDGAALARFLLRWQGVAPVDADPPPLTGDAALERLAAVIEQLAGLPLPASVLEREILPVRIPGYLPRLLDELGSLGEVRWVGRGRTGPDDGRIALFRPGQEELLALRWAGEGGEAPSGPRHHALRAALAQLGASFYRQLYLAAGGGSDEEVLAALWDLVWAGEVTNDTFAPLRALRWRRPHRRARPGRLTTLGPPEAAGRWSLVPRSLFDSREEGRTTRALHRAAHVLLDRYGLLCRPVVAAEGLEGGFAALYPILSALEERGHLRRGYFVEGLGGSQFARPPAVEALRLARDPHPGAPVVHLLAAADPANPYGTILPWPRRDEADHRSFARVAGAHVVLVDGVPVLYLERNGEGLLTFPAADDPELAGLAAAALSSLVTRGLRRELRIATVDGVPAAGSPLRGALESAGFRPGYRGLIWSGRARLPAAGDQIRA